MSGHRDYRAMAYAVTTSEETLHIQKPRQKTEYVTAVITTKKHAYSAVCLVDEAAGVTVAKARIHALNEARCSLIEHLFFSTPNQGGSDAQSNHT